MLYMCFVKGFVIFPEVQPMYFCDVRGDLCKLANGALANSVFRDLVISLSPGAVYLMMPYVHVVS